MIYNHNKQSIMSNNITQGVQYITNNNLLDKFKNYTYSEWEVENHSIILDEFTPFPETGDDFEDAIKKNGDIQFDLLNIIGPATGYQLGCYIYELIIYIKNDLI